MHRLRITPIVLILLAAGVFFTGIDWGLPSRKNNVFLQGADDHGLRLEALTSQVPEVDENRPADVVSPAQPSDAMVQVNETAAEKAQILCRYRLYSNQPDEMITFRALSRMKPASGDLDPRLYQYGGLWIYPVGILIEAGRLLGFLEIGDRALYIGDPEIFAKFYIVARAYSAAWGLVAVWAVYALLRRVSAAVFPAIIGAICFISMPVVVDLAHEAKPHLPAVALVILAALAADYFRQSRNIKWAVMAGMLCGAAAGMALWAVVALALLPLLRNFRAIAFASIAAVVMYSATNPYVVYHLLHDPTVLRSNLGNTAAMYHVNEPASALANAAQLIAAGTGPVVLIAGLAGLCFLRGAGRMLAVAASVALIGFIAAAAGKPGEYARFAILPDALLIVAAAVGMGRIRNGPLRVAVGIVLAGATITWSVPYLKGFLNDSTRAVVAERLESVHDQFHVATPTLGVFADPAPYCLPPVDLDGWKIVKLPRQWSLSRAANAVDVLVLPAEPVLPWMPGTTPISWADKRFDVIYAGSRHVLP